MLRRGNSTAPLSLAHSTKIHVQADVNDTQPLDIKILSIRLSHAARRLR